jgi:hypothetical protein
LFLYTFLLVKIKNKFNSNQKIKNIKNIKN